MDRLLRFWKIKTLFIPRQQRWRGYRNSQRLSIFPSVRNENPLTATIFHRSLPNLYSMFIPMTNVRICSFIKKWQKLLPWRPFFFLIFNAYLPMFLTWKHEGNFLSYFQNTYIKVQHNFSAIFCKFWQKLLPWQHFYFAIFLISSLQKWYYNL